MKYLWTEDTGAGLHFWKLVNQLFFDNALVVESKESNQGILDSLISLNAKEEDEYYIAFDYVPDNQDIRNKYRQLKQLVEKSEAKVIILDMICFEYFILAFDKLVSWTGTGKTDKIKMREDILAAIEDHRIDLSKIDNQMTMHLIVARLKVAKSKRQIIVVTHNANIPVNGDSEYIISMNSDTDIIQVNKTGTMDDTEIRQEICDVMEGTKDAFEMRAKKYHFNISE